MFSDEQEGQICNGLLGGAYNLLIGAGVSLDSTDRSDTNLPSGAAFKHALCALKGVSEGASLQRVFSTLTPDEVKRHVTDRFSGCRPGPSVQKLKSYLWRRIFTLNVDDALQAAYSGSDALQELRPLNFTDDFFERDNLDTLQAIHLHGWVGRPEDGYVFSTSEYVRLIRSINPWMVNLCQFIPNEPFIITGTQFDEVDIAYYMSFRTKENSRKDRAPSIFVTPHPDGLTATDCDKYDLLLFKGTVTEFIDYFLPKTGTAKVPHMLLDPGTNAFLPKGVSNRERLAFFSDFEVIPSNAQDGNGLPRFLYGAGAGWPDICRGVDIGRRTSAQLQVDIAKTLGRNPSEKSFILLVDDTGAGKSTVLKRVGVELARNNVRALWCYTSARLEVGRIASAIDLIDEDIIIFFDNLADNIGQVAAIFDACEKSNITFVGCERGYRLPYLTEALRSIDYSVQEGRRFDNKEASTLIELYGRYGLIGTQAAVENRAAFAETISRDPIAVACCRILNDFSPLDHIVRSIWTDSKAGERLKYAVAALAARCFRGGLRYEVLRSISGQGDWNEQFQWDHPLPLCFSEEFGREFVKPLNESVGEQILGFCARSHQEFLLNVFVELGNAIASRVSRSAIRRRASEARLAGRLFDYDRVVHPYLGDRALEFYDRTAEKWRWNSRYWEQVALLHLEKFYSAPNSLLGREAYGQALQHARHSTSVEWHPHPLTTRGKILFAYADGTGEIDCGKFDEGQKCLYDAIMMEQQWARLNIQPFMVLLSGTRRYLEKGGALSERQTNGTLRVMEICDRRFKQEPLITEEVERLRSKLRDL